MSILPGVDLFYRYVVAGLSAGAVLFGYLPAQADAPEMAHEDSIIIDIPQAISGG